MATYFTVGPSQLYPSIKNHIQNALKDDILSISHRSKKFFDIYEEVSSQLKEFLNIPADYQILFYGSATECMERLIQNCVTKNTYHFVCGAFSKRFYNVAKDYQKDVLIQQVFIKNNEWFNFDLNFDSNKNPPEMFCVTQNETSTGVKIDLDKIYKLKQDYPQSLIAIDAVSCLPIYQIDFTKIDAVLFSVQKVFGLPAGLGVLIISPKVIQKTQKIKQSYPNYSQGTYFNFEKMTEQSQKWQTPQTPNILAIYLLNQILKDFRALGLDKIRQNIQDKAEIIYDFFDQNKFFKPLVRNLEIRSQTTICLQSPINSDLVLNYLAKNGFIVSGGYGQSQKEQVRIANFPATNYDQTKKLLSVIDSLSLNQF
jgi:phosphoserine aminotransferase